MPESSTELLIEAVGGAMGLPPEERDGFVRRACPDAAAQREAMCLIRALERAGGFMDSATLGFAGAHPPVNERPGDTVGPYTLLEQVGEGGFGVVFSAEQRVPVQRRVALKIIKLGMDTRAVVARFEAERQALAVMDHPCIAKVLDAGATQAGRPYFVMELVRGEPITRYCAAHALSARQRLELFVQVCLAVQHAHTKGIIHRDLKPANILVSEVDGRPLPRIIDFGIAKATGAHAAGGAEKTAFTEARQLIGTPEYMSPEQAQSPGVDIDTRTDVYSLGVLLYELLTGETPLDGATLRSAAWDQMLRMIRETDPPKPSTRAAAAPGPASAATPARSAALKGDLDWIVMRCLEKDRARRYQTAEGLAADIRRHLGGQAVLAAPPSRAYQLRKFAGRHRAGVGAGCVAAASLMLGLSAALWQAGIAARQRDEAESRRKETDQVAEFQAAQLRDIDPQLMGALLREDLLAGVRGDAGQEQRAQLAGLLDAVNLTDVALRALDRSVFARAIAAIDQRFTHQPVIRADLLLTTGQTMMELGLLEVAEVPLNSGLALRREQLGHDDPDTIRAEAVAAELELRRGRLSEAQEHLDRTLARSRRVLGEDDPITVHLLSNSGMVRFKQGKTIEAERVFREVLERRQALLTPDDPRLLGSMTNMAIALNALGRPGEAERFYRLAYEGFRRVGGAEHRDTLKAMANLAVALRIQGKYDEAEPLLRESLAKLRARLGGSHPETLNACFSLGQLLMARGSAADLAEAEGIVREGLEGRRRALGALHTETLTSMDQMGDLRAHQSRLTEAESIFRDLLAAYESLGAEGSPRALGSRLDLGRVLTALARYADAETTFLEVSRTLAAAHGGRGAGRGPGGGDPCAEDLVKLYTAWDTAEPGKGYDAKAEAWKSRLAPALR